MTIIGFDSYATTTMPPPGNPFQFAYFNFNNFSNPLTKMIRFDQQVKLAQDLGYKVGGYAMWRHNVDPVAQADWIIRNYKPLDLPLALDFEDKYAVKGVRMVEHISTYGKRLTDAGLDVICYTATWWWNVWYAPYHNWLAQLSWSPYDYKLWECDPDPDTVTPGLGKWDGKVIGVQYLLDVPGVHGFNATIDYDKIVDEEWYYDKIGGGGPVVHKASIDVPKHADKIELTINRV